MHSSRSASQQLRQLRSASLIDHNGREIPITEQMILQACRQLEQQAPWPQRRNR